MATRKRIKGPDQQSIVPLAPKRWIAERTSLATLTEGKSGRTIVDALTCGPFAVHRNLARNGDVQEWALTHTLSGMRLTGRSFKTAQEAMELGAEIFALQLDWGFDTIAKLPHATKERMQEFMRSRFGGGGLKITISVEL